MGKFMFHKSPDQPKSITQAFWCLYVFLGIMVVKYACSYLVDTEAVISLVATSCHDCDDESVKLASEFIRWFLRIHPALMIILNLSLYISLIRKISSGHNWARIVFTLLAAFNIAVEVRRIIIYWSKVLYIDYWADAFYWSGFNLILTLLTTAALFFLYRPQSNEWFKEEIGKTG